LALRGARTNDAAGSAAAPPIAQAPRTTRRRLTAESFGIGESIVHRADDGQPTTRSAAFHHQRKKSHIVEKLLRSGSLALV
jgi:hypothetical protein